MLKYKILLLILSFLLVGNCISQEKGDTTFTVKTRVVGGDTIPYYSLNTIPIYGERTFKNKRQAKKYGRLKRYVVKVYPYAQVAGEMLRHFDDTMRLMKSESKKKRYIKKIEKELKEEFTGELKKLTIKQGIILVKLIDRETGNTSYDLIKELRGSFSAFVWQSLARLFGSNLKLEYDPNGEDQMIEEIVQMIERGQIPVKKRERKS